jgi:hypothetical protein
MLWQSLHAVLVKTRDRHMHTKASKWKYLVGSTSADKETRENGVKKSQDTECPAGTQELCNLLPLNFPRPPFCWLVMKRSFTKISAIIAMRHITYRVIFHGFKPKFWNTNNLFFSKKTTKFDKIMSNQGVQANKDTKAEGQHTAVSSAVSPLVSESTPLTMQRLFSRIG